MTNFELIAGQPALDLVNTLDWRFRESGPEELLNSYDDLLRFTEQSGLLSRRQMQALHDNAGRNTATRVLVQAKHLREEAAQVFYAILDVQTPPADAIKKLDERLHVAQSNRTLRWISSRAELAWPSGASHPELPLWLLAQSTADLLTSEEVKVVRECANLECRWLFLDTSRNRSRRWCDMKICGNRIKARRFKAQHKA